MIPENIKYLFESTNYDDIKLFVLLFYKEYGVEKLKEWGKSFPCLNTHNKIHATRLYRPPYKLSGNIIMVFEDDFAVIPAYIENMYFLYGKKAVNSICSDRDFSAQYYNK